MALKRTLHTKNGELVDFEQTGLVTEKDTEKNSLMNKIANFNLEAKIFLDKPKASEEKYKEILKFYSSCIDKGIKLDIQGIINYFKVCTKLGLHSKVIENLKEIDKRKYKFNDKEKKEFNNYSGLNYLLEARRLEHQQNPDYDKILYLLQEAIKIKPDSLGTKKKIAKILYLKKDYEKALKFAKETDNYEMAYKSSMALGKTEKAYNFAILTQEPKLIMESLHELITKKSINQNFDEINAVIIQTLDYIIKGDFAKITEENKNLDKLPSGSIDIYYMSLCIKALTSMLHNNFNAAKYEIGLAREFKDSHYKYLNNNRTLFIDSCLTRAEEKIEHNSEVIINKKGPDALKDNLNNNQVDIKFAEPLFPLLEKLSLTDIIIKSCKNNLENQYGDVEHTKKILFKLCPSFSKNPQLYSLSNSSNNEHVDNLKRNSENRISR